MACSGCVQKFLWLNKIVPTKIWMTRTKSDCMFGWNALGEPAEQGGEVLATTRLLPAGVSYAGEVSIGRVVTAQSVRGADGDEN